MKVLWLCNIPMPQITRIMGIQMNSGGGWITGLYNQIISKQNIQPVILFPKKGKVKIHRAGEAEYIGFSQRHTKYDKRTEALFDKILCEAKPDIVHIWGTEYPHTLAMINACERQNMLDGVLINIQGLCSIYSKHYFACLPYHIINRYTFRDILRNENIAGQQRDFIKRGRLEVEALKKVMHVVGRTDWDKACTTQINPEVQYHFCNEILRDEFYKHQWSLDNCERHSIFLSQGNYPLKGLHFAVEAMPLILEKFSDAHLYVAGADITKYNTFKEKIKLSSYGKYIRDLLYRYDLWDRVTFTGILDEQAMCQRYLKSHVFVSASSIENSPNSVGEAMLLGVPVVSSDVGGVKNLITHNEDGFVYQADAPYMLAYYVCKMFEDNQLAKRFSENARRHANETHDRERIVENMLNVYSEIARGQD